MEPEDFEDMMRRYRHEFDDMMGQMRQAWGYALQGWESEEAYVAATSEADDGTANDDCCCGRRRLTGHN